MKNVIALVMTVIMMLTLSASAFAWSGPLTLNEAKKAALDYVGVNESEATFMTAHKCRDDGRHVYEIEFFCNDTKYDLDVDAQTGSVTDFSTEFHSGSCVQSLAGTRYDRDDWDDRYDYDWDDRYDCDWDDSFEWDD